MPTLSAYHMMILSLILRRGIISITDPFTHSNRYNLTYTLVSALLYGSEIRLIAFFAQINILETKLSRIDADLPSILFFIPCL